MLVYQRVSTVFLIETLVDDADIGGLATAAAAEAAALAEEPEEPKTKTQLGMDQDGMRVAGKHAKRCGKNHGFPSENDEQMVGSPHLR